MRKRTGHKVCRPVHGAMAVRMFVLISLLLFVVFLNPVSSQSEESKPLNVSVSFIASTSVGWHIRLTCTNSSGGIPDGEVGFRRNGEVIEPNTTLVFFVIEESNYIEFILNRSQEGYFSCFTDNGENSSEIGLAAGYTHFEVNHIQPEVYYVVSPINTARAVNLSCPLRPGVLQQYYSVLWYQAQPPEMLNYTDFDITVELMPSLFSYMFACIVTVNNQYLGFWITASVAELASIGNSIQNRTISGSDSTAYFECDIISSENSFLYSAYWTVGQERFNCTDNIPNEYITCIWYPGDNRTSLLINVTPYYNFDVGVFLVTCNLDHNIEALFLNDSSYQEDYGTTMRGAHLIIEPGIVVYSFNRSLVRLLCLIGGSTLIDGALFYKDGRILTNSGTNQATILANAGDGTIEFNFTQEQEGMFSCSKNGVMSTSIGLAASPDEDYNGTTRNRYIVFPSTHTSRTIQLSCDIRPGALRERYSVQWLELNSETNDYTVLPDQSTFDISVTAVLLLSEQQFMCRVTIEHLPGNTSVYNGPDIVLNKEELASLGYDIQNRIISGSDSTTYFECDIISSENSLSYSVYWTVEQERFDCTDNTTFCLWHPKDNSTSLLINATQFDVGVFLVTCNLDHNIETLFLNDPSYNDDYGTSRREAYLIIVPGMVVEYPYPFNRSLVRLLCVIGGSTLIDGALFYKDDRILTNSGTNQATILANAGDGIIEFSFTQEQEGMFSCGKNGLRSTSIGLAASPDEVYNGTTRNRYIVFPSTHTSRTIQLSCDIRPGTLRERYTVQWLEINSETNEYIVLPNQSTFDISVTAVLLLSEQQFMWRVTIEHLPGNTSVYNGPDIVLHNRKFASISNGLQNRTISGSDSTAYFECDIISSENSLLYSVYWTVGLERFDCTDNTTLDINSCVWHPEENSTSLLIDATQYDVGVFLVTCNLDHNIEALFLNDPSYHHDDYVTSTREAYLTIVSSEVAMVVEYPYSFNRSLVRLHCLIGGSTLIDGALFYKDGRILTNSGTNQATIITNAGDGTIEFSFNQEQEGMLSCGKNGLRSTSIGLAASPDEDYNGTTRNRYIVFPSTHTSRTIQLSCDIRPGALRERYTVQWLELNSETNEYIVLPNQSTFDISVTAVLLLSEQQFMCRVTIEHFLGSTSVYNGPDIALHKEELVGIEESDLNAEIVQGETVEMECRLTNNETNISMYWVFDGVKYDCITSLDVNVTGNGCYISGLISYLIIRETKSLSVGDYLVQCVVKHNFLSPFVNDPSFDDDFIFASKNGTITVKKEVPVLEVAEIVAVTSVSLVFLSVSVLLLGSLIRVWKHRKSFTPQHRLKIGHLQSAYKAKPPHYSRFTSKRQRQRYGEEEKNSCEPDIHMDTGPPEEQIYPNGASYKRVDDAETTLSVDICLPDVFEHIKTLIFTSEGRSYRDDSNDFILEIPQGAVPESQTVTIDVGVALFGPFQFPEGLRPVSPVFWVCVRGQPDFIFSKPVSLTIPHFLNLENDEDIRTLGLTFLKADHQSAPGGIQDLHQFGCKSDFSSLKTLAKVECTHFCSLCIGSKNTPRILASAKFCITAVIPKFSVPVNKTANAYFFVTFFSLQTCLKKVAEIIGKKNLEESYIVKREEFVFGEETAVGITFNQPESQGLIGIRGKKKIYRNEVDFFVEEKLSREELEDLQDEDFYPPRFEVFFAPSKQYPNLRGCKISFLDQIDFDIFLEEPESAQSNDPAPSMATPSVRSKPIPGEQKPTMRRLLMIEYTPPNEGKKEFRTLDKISPHWIDIAYYLDVDEHVISEARGDRNPTREVMNHWIQSNAKASWIKIIKAMKALQLKVAAVELHTALLNANYDSDDSDS